MFGGWSCPRCWKRKSRPRGWSWGWGVEGSLVFGEPENEESRKRNKEEKRERTGSRLRGRKGGVDEEAVTGLGVKRAKVRQRGKCEGVWGKTASGSECRKRAA